MFASNNIAMECERVIHQLSKNSGIILISHDTNEEFYINEEALLNSQLLEKHKKYNNEKIPLRYNRDIVEFLALALNNPLNEEALIQNKIQELQKDNKHANATLVKYASALKEFDISLATPVKSLPKSSLLVRKPNNHLSPNSTMENISPNINMEACIVVPGIVFYIISLIYLAFLPVSQK